MSRRVWLALGAVALAAAALTAALAPSFRASWAPLELLIGPPLDPPAGSEVTLTVRSERDGRTVDPRLFSFNLAPWPNPPDHHPVPDPTFVAMMKTLRPALLRFPAGHWSQTTCWALPGAPPCSEEQRHGIDAAELAGFMATAKAVGAEALIAVNLKTGTPAQAAALVHHLNVENNHGVVWFELGNEPDLPKEPRSTPAAEVERYRRFAAAMRAVDPDVRLVGGVFMTGAHVAPWGMRVDWMGPFSAGVGRGADAYSWHWYPLDSDNRNPASGAFPSVEHLLQEASWNWPPSGLGFAERACRRMEQVRAATGAEHWVTELGPDSGAVQAPGVTDGQAAAVWLADALPRLAACGANAVFQFAIRQGAESNLILMRHDRTPTPMWASYQLLSRHWRGEMMPAVSDTDDPALGFHAVRDEEGALVVILVNKGDAPRSVRIQWQGAQPDEARLWTVEADSPTSTTTRVNGAELTRELVLAGFPPQEADPGGPHRLPAYSVTLLRAW